MLTFQITEDEDRDITFGLYRNDETLYETEVPHGVDTDGAINFLVKCAKNPAFASYSKAIEDFISDLHAMDKCLEKIHDAHGDCKNECTEEELQEAYEWWEELNNCGFTQLEAKIN